MKSLVKSPNSPISVSGMQTFEPLFKAINAADPLRRIEILSQLDWLDIQNVMKL